MNTAAENVTESRGRRGHRGRRPAAARLSFDLRNVFTAETTGARADGPEGALGQSVSHVAVENLARLLFPRGGGGALVTLTPLHATRQKEMPVARKHENTPT